MNNNFRDKFIEISKKRWIKGVSNHDNSVGLTFENLLDKPFDSMYFPDYYGLEIKTTTRFSRYPITLFSLSFTGPDLYETNRILALYGKRDYKYEDKKILMGYINTKDIIKLTEYSFKLDIDNNERKIYLCIYDENDNMIERNAYILFDDFIDRLKLKLSNLVIVKASKKKIDGNLYYRYYAYKKYSLKNDINYIELINKNIIKVLIMCRISRSGEKMGEQRNKSLIFQIDKDKIEELFNYVQGYDLDYINKK